MRTQLSLYVPAPEAESLATVRRIVDPVQSRLIPPHVTLCRDEDLVGIAPDDVRARLATGVGPLTLAFGAAERFGGHGLLLPCVAGQAAFRALRALVLGNAAPRDHTPHLTLAHPRNPSAPGNDAAVARALPVPLTITFTRVHWIEQESGAPWRVRHTFGLDGAP
jgi:2'-5' RNA ligase